MVADISTDPIPMQWRDRPWIDAYVTVLCGPFAMPSLDDLRAAVARLADRHPQSRLTWSLDPTRLCWRNDRSVHDVAVGRDWDGDADLGSVLDGLAGDRSLAPPLTLVRYPHYIGLRMSHSVGDGRLFLSVISAVLRTAITGEVAQWLPVPITRSPLTEAAVKTFVRHPALLKRAIDDRTRPHADGRIPDTRAWSPARRTIHVSMPRDRADEVFEWGKRYAPGASRFALQVSLILRAMKRVGLDVSTDTRVIADLRRYLGWRYVDGNFVAGVPMTLSAQMDPELLSATIKKTMVSGRPLANQVATALRMRGAAGMGTATSYDGAALPRATFTNMGKSPEIDCLPFTSDLLPVYTGSVPPEGPLGITFLLGESPAVVSLNATFHDNVVDSAAVHAALSAAAFDPIGLLAQPAVGVE